ncbi:N-acetylmuramoyl-L-alanine amidase [Candidatus Dependentiae bacterium]
MKKIIYIFLFGLFFLFFETKLCGTFTIMIDPAGDSQYAGRLLEDCLERGITSQFVQSLQKKLLQSIADIKVFFTRRPGEAIGHLQNANFSNRLDVDFYLSIHFYKEKEVKPRMYMYTFSYNDDFVRAKPGLYFYPYDKAHIIHRTETKALANVAKEVFLSETHKKMFDFQGMISLPFKPLIGVKAPAIGVEIGLKKKDDWHDYVDVFVEVISNIVNKPFDTPVYASSTRLRATSGYSG